jgi:hypothetical protein
MEFLQEEEGRRRRGSMVRILTVVFVIVFWSASVFCGGWEGLKRDRDLLKGRAVEVADLAFRESEKLARVSNADQCDRVCERILGLASEWKFLMIVAERVDKVIFGLEILGALLASGAELRNKQYNAVVLLFDKQVKEALRAIDEAKHVTVTIESRKLLQRTRSDLIDFWEKR